LLNVLIIIFCYLSIYYFVVKLDEQTVTKQMHWYESAAHGCKFSIGF